ncbi:hypothetical protein [Mesorhizobium helmanticense]|uniref:Secreted protein n=1 Tax=Mesorhizobium helmanticense TaxID=1776423 RepID=A0A2T4IS93_9HYPH|nr:hypothetical protein [Mesorhizobium helmanticense]PTE08509.1 hypothetical protein C9427_21320 [Mesorhizobium helmanticense]
MTNVRAAFLFAGCFALVTIARALGTEFNCTADANLGHCLVDEVRQTRMAQEKAWSTSSELADTVVAAIAIMEKQAPRDAENTIQLIFERGVALEISEKSDAAVAAYNNVCTTLQSFEATGDPPSEVSKALCDYAKLKIAMTGSDMTIMAEAVDAVLAHANLASTTLPDDVLSVLKAENADHKSRMAIAEALADLSVLKSEEDRKLANQIAGGALDIVEHAAADPDLDFTVAAHVLSASVLVAPAPWDSGADAVDPLPLLERIILDFEKIFGAESPRIWDALDQLRFATWNSRFGTMKTEFSSKPDHSQDWNPLEQHNDTLSGVGSSDEITLRTAEITKRLFHLALLDVDLGRQEKRLESVAASATSLEGVGALAQEILDKRGEVIRAAISEGKLPEVLDLQNEVKIAELKLYESDDRSKASSRLDILELKISQFADASPQLPRALLTLADARSTLANLDEAARKDQIIRIAGLVGRSERIMIGGQSDPGIGDIDLFMAKSDLEKLR